MRLLTAVTALAVLGLASGAERLDRAGGEHAVATDSTWRSPEAERLALHVPPGFEVQLVAAEPDIDKPMNLAFDAHGRLWVTHSREYPIAATPGAGRDRVSILEDTTGDGRADTLHDVRRRPEHPDRHRADARWRDRLQHPEPLSDDRP